MAQKEKEHPSRRGFQWAVTDRHCYLEDNVAVCACVCRDGPSIGQLHLVTLDNFILYNLVLC